LQARHEREFDGQCSSGGSIGAHGPAPSRNARRDCRRNSNGRSILIKLINMQNAMPERPPAPYLTAREAAAELGVSLPTLYAYVSRGLVRSEPVPGDRMRRYRADDVRALRERRAPPASDASPPV